MSPRSSLISVLLFLSLSVFAFSQRGVANDPLAVVLANQSIAAVTQGMLLHDVTLVGDATWVTGPDREEGNATLVAHGTRDSRIDLKLKSGSRIEIRTDLNGAPSGEWTNPNGSSARYASHNCWTDAAWFFPAFSVLSNVSKPKFVFSYIGRDSWNGLTVEHLRAYQALKGFKELPRLSAMDFYLDPASHLPLGISFMTHPDKDADTDIVVKVLFADYHSVGGVEIPFRIQRHIGGGVLDVRVKSATFNSNPSSDTFSIQ